MGTWAQHGHVDERCERGQEVGRRPRVGGEGRRGIVVVELRRADVGPARNTRGKGRSEASRVMMCQVVESTWYCR